MTWKNNFSDFAFVCGFPNRLTILTYKKTNLVTIMKS